MWLRAGEARARTLDRGREAVAAKAVVGLPCSQREGRARGAGAPEARRDRERQRLRRADEDRARVLARSDYEGAFRGGRGVSAEYVSVSISAARLEVDSLVFAFDPTAVVHDRLLSGISISPRSHMPTHGPLMWEQAPTPVAPLRCAPEFVIDQRLSW